MANQEEVRADYIGGKFLEPVGEPLVSVDPARDGEPVLTTRWSAARVGEAVASAKAAQPGWARRSLEERWAHLVRFRAAIVERKEAMAEAIALETGKLLKETRVEVQTVIGRFDLVLAQIQNDLREGQLPGFPNEALRWHPHGVVAVIGPFNFPIHLCNSHVLPALLLGNTVVMKPSEVAPLSGIRYAEAAHAAGLPPGVFQLVHGRGATGAALVAHPDVHALAFTGSWPVGHAITKAALDRPELLLALEMGGKNTAILCEDTDLRQAAHELVVGSYLTTGQRCTCTDRVLVHASRAKELIDALVPLVRSLRFSHQRDASAFAGPLATESGRIKLERAMAAAEAAGAEVPVEGARLPGGFYRTASIHALPRGVHDVPGYTDTELFGPDLGVETFDDDAEAIAVVNASPYGFANSIFTSDDARFERYYRETRVGILNRNRSTNQASPRLPFGGAGRSGNFRPAGSFAPRNLAIPVAVQSNAPFALPFLPDLRAHLPASDLARLEAAHEREEAEEARRSAIETPRPLGPAKPKTKGAIRLPQSTALLERFAAANRTVREKKPVVFDAVRSRGNFFVSVDDAPLSLMDAMSQTATLPFGFNDDSVVRAIVDGTFGETLLRSFPITHGVGAEIASRYADTLRALVPNLPTVCFTACGAEANEKAYALCQNQREGSPKLLAFEGSFHGRTLLSLYASYSPEKRAPFEIAGYEVTFAPYPSWASPDREGPADPEGWRETLGAGDLEGFRARFAEHADPLVREEARALLFVHEELASGAYFAVVIEPMQSEGGDRYATPRFYRGLRLLTRALEVPLILDEVQCGFGLGGAQGPHHGFLWHPSFGLVDRDGRPDTPDCVLFAKRAQVGVVMSRFEDPEPTQAFAASMVRGRLHAELLEESDAASRVEAWVRRELPTLLHRFPQFVADPRARGFAFAFELPSPAHLAQILAQRFARGAIVYGAGTRTVRYRLNASTTEADVRFLFRTILQSLATLEAHGWTADEEGAKVAEWDEIPLPPYGGSPRADAGASLDRVVVRRARSGEQTRWMPEIQRLGLEGDERELAPAFAEPDGVAVVAIETDEKGVERLVGAALARPLYEAPALFEGGPFAREEAAYALRVVVEPCFGAALVDRLEHERLRSARAEETADRSPRYRFLVGEDGGEGDPSARIHDRYGAFRLDGVDGDASLRRYAVPLHGVPAKVPAPLERGSEALDVMSSAVAPFARAPSSLVRAARAGLLSGAAANKLTITNYLTPAVVRVSEHVAALAPDLPHLYLTSGRDETIDKAVRLLRWHRKAGRVVVGLEGGYVGHTTAAARSISDPSTHRQGPAHFDFPRIPHPALVGDERAIEALRGVVLEAGGAEKVLGVFVEMIGERSGLVASPSFLARLAAFRGETRIPIVLVETASAYFKSGRGPFASSPLARAGGLADGGSFVPDVLVWATGGQQGFLHVSEALFVPNPLTFVSTWDGDELSMIQASHQLRAARRLDVGALARELDEGLAPLVARGFSARGEGLHRVIDAGERAGALVEALRAAGLETRAYPNGCVPIAPALDEVGRAAERLAKVAISPA